MATKTTTRKIAIEASTNLTLHSNYASLRIRQTGTRQHEKQVPTRYERCLQCSRFESYDGSRSASYVDGCIVFKANVTPEFV